MRPQNLRRFTCNLKLIARGPKAPDQIVMQMERFIFPSRNSVDINPRQKRLARRVDPHQRFLKSLSRGSRIERSIALFHMPSRQQPSKQTMVVNHQHALLFGMEDQRGAGDVTRAKLLR